MYEIEHWTSILSNNLLILENLVNKLQFEDKKESELIKAKQEYIKQLENRFKSLTPKITDYKTSKTDSRISTIRHGLNLLSRSNDLEILRRQIIKEKDISYLDNDQFVDSFNTFLAHYKNFFNEEVQSSRDSAETLDSILSYSEGRLILCPLARENTIRSRGFFISKIELTI